MTDFFKDLDGNGGKGNPKSNGKFTLTPVTKMLFDSTASYLIEDLIPREGLVLVWGPPKCCKSFWTFDAVGHIALGRMYRGKRVEQGGVIYVAAEGERGVRNRCIAFRQARIVADDEMVPFFVMTTRLDLVAEIDELIAAITSQLGATPCKVIVLDTLNRTFAGSEGKDEDMAAYVQAADRLRVEFHCTVILIHHCGIDDRRPRGHTSLTAAVDAQIAVKREADGKTFIATLELSRDGPADKIVLTCQLDPIDIGVDDNGKIITSCVVDHLDTPEATQSKKPKKLTAPQRRALELLYEAINIGGEIPPADNHIPAGVRCVREEVWRDYCYKGGISSGEQEARRKAYTFARDVLIADHYVGCWNELVWPVKAQPSEHPQHPTNPNLF